MHHLYKKQLISKVLCTWHKIRESTWYAYTYHIVDTFISYTTMKRARIQFPTAKWSQLICLMIAKPLTTNAWCCAPPLCTQFSSQKAKNGNPLFEHSIRDSTAWHWCIEYTTLPVLKDTTKHNWANFS